MSWQIARRLPRFWVSSARVAHLNKRRGSSEPFDEVAPSQAMENGTITPEIGHGKETSPLDAALRERTRDQIEGIAHDAVTMLDACARQRLNDDICDLLAHGSEPRWYLSCSMRLAAKSGL
jgi:hypothetical protein